jgi:protein-arginine kinase activator protein McsA
LLQEATALGELRERLRRAIAHEEFETAARIRDEIRNLE